VPGASAYYKGTVVSYSNEIKELVLNVSKETLNVFGAVSKETSEEMLKGILEKMNTDYAISITGILGPDGGSEEKPVGTVWMSVGNKHKIESQKMYFRYDRSRNLQASAVSALNMLRKFISEND
jgi:nicotinamide-nucleotide amidase